MSPNARYEVQPAHMPPSRVPASAAAIWLAATAGLAVAAWVFAIDRMEGMDMGVATELGSFPSFLVAWLAMMLPSALPPVATRADSYWLALVVPQFVGSYLAIWTLVGLAVYGSYRPHGTTIAGVLTIAAGLYELTPLKRHTRRRCRESFHSGLWFGIFCLGSSIGLMLIPLSLGVMSPTWMTSVAVLVLGQKLLPPTAAIDVPLALAIVALGFVVVIAPSAVPGVTQSM